MATVTIPQIVERLKKLPPDKLMVVYDFVSYLAEWRAGNQIAEGQSGAYQTSLASQAVLQRDWGRPEEDQAWGNL